MGMPLSSAAIIHLVPLPLRVSPTPVPLFRRDERAIQESAGPVQPFVSVKGGEDRSPYSSPCPLFLSPLEPSPHCRGSTVAMRQVLPPHPLRKT